MVFNSVAPKSLFVRSITAAEWQTFFKSIQGNFGGGISSLIPSSSTKGGLTLQNLLRKIFRMKHSFL